MANAPVPSVATATPVAADTVLGVKAGAVKRFTIDAVGKALLVVNGVALNNYFVGAAGNITASGAGNTGAGYRALEAVSSGAYNTTMGFCAGVLLTTGSENTAFGKYALLSVTTSSNNTAFGSGALQTSTGASNTAVGASALLNATTAGNNVAVGSAALLNNLTGDANVAVGSSAARKTTGSYNAAFGGDSLYENTTGTANSAFGYQASYFNVSGSGNAAFGNQALIHNLGSYNSAFGEKAGDGNTTGTRNTFVGNTAGYLATTGNDNTVVGAFAANGSASDWANSGVVAVGAYALTAIQTGAGNTTAVGFKAGFTLTTASGGVFLGNQAGYYETGANKLFIDNAPRASEADARVKALIYGVFAAAPANQFVTVNGQIRAASLGVGNSASATAVGTLSKKMEVFDASGASIGFVPIYTTIT